MRTCRALLAVCVVGSSGILQAQRLPGGVRPEHYSLTITPDLAKARFAGSETIEVVLEEPTSIITLNAAEIEFGGVKAAVREQGTGNRKQTAAVTLDAVKEQASLTFTQPLPAGLVTLEIEYTGILNDKLRGFYLSKTKARSYGVTQFEATDARRAFPSFDEPALKANFDVTLVVDVGDTAISNTKIVSDKPGPMAGKHTIAFAPTPKMSTYLVAWLVGDFVCAEGKSDGVPIRACATPDKAKLTKFALESAKWTLKYYDKYFGIHYPLAKLDMVAIPDFEAGAMENFGCITYRETEMLVDEKHSTLAARKEVAETIAHELAHQWFGDLVTPDWWDNLWLNEGFATWMESKAAAAWHPKWEYDVDQAVNRNRIMDEDAARTTRPIRSRAETPAEINEMFDDNAYGKAGAVIGMVENYVGEEVFRKGVQAYLAAHLYANATAQDFWDTQARVSGLPVDKIMQSFVEQAGVPLVTIGGAGAGAPVTQSQFVWSGTPMAKAWTIPVCFKGEACRLLAPEQTTLDVPAAPCVSANAAAKGYYRTAYSAKDLAAVVANAETALTPPERIGLLGDEWALMRGGQKTSVGDFLDLVLALKADPNATVMDIALGRVETIESTIANDADRVRLDGVVRREFGGAYAALGGPKRHETEGHADLRETLFDALGRAKDPAVLAQADNLAAQLFDGKKSGDPMMGDAAVMLATRNGDAEMYDRLMKISREATDPELKEAALHVLTRFQSPALVARTLEYALSAEMRNQDSWALIALLLERRETQDQAWVFVEQHWAEIEKKATANSEARIVEAAGAFCTVEKRDAVAAFVRTHPVAATDRTLTKSLDAIDGCIRLRETQEPELRRWLDDHPGG